MMQLVKKHIKNEKGLTLIELLAVIVILGIIAAIAIPSISSIIEKSREDAIKADAMQILNSAQTYVSANGTEAAASGSTTAKTLTATELGDYVENVTTFDSYTVNVTDSGLTLTASGHKGNVTIQFTNATINGINATPKGDRTIAE